MSEKIKHCVLCGNKEFASKGDPLTEDDDLYNTLIFCDACGFGYRLHSSICFVSGELADRKTLRKLLQRTYNVINEFLRLSPYAMINGVKTCYTFWCPTHGDEKKRQGFILC